MADTAVYDSHDRDGIAVFLLLARLERVLPLSLLQCPLKIGVITAAIPRLDTDKGAVLLVGRPDSHDGSIEGHLHKRIKRGGAERNLVHLIVFKDQRVVGKELFVQSDGVVGKNPHYILDIGLPGSIAAGNGGDRARSPV